MSKLIEVLAEKAVEVAELRQMRKEVKGLKGNRELSKKIVAALRKAEEEHEALESVAMKMAL